MAGVGPDPNEKLSGDERRPGPVGAEFEVLQEQVSALMAEVVALRKSIASGRRRKRVLPQRMDSGPAEGAAGEPPDMEMESSKGKPKLRIVVNGAQQDHAVEDELESILAEFTEVEPESTSPPKVQVPPESLDEELKSKLGVSLPEKPLGPAFNEKAFRKDFEEALSHPEPVEWGEDAESEPASAEPPSPEELQDLQEHHPKLLQEVEEYNARTEKPVDDGDASSLETVTAAERAAMDELLLRLIEDDEESSDEVVEMGFVSDTEAILAETERNHQETEQTSPHPDALAAIPASAAIRALALPWKVSKDHIVCRVAAPIDEEALAELRTTTGLAIEAEVAPISFVVNGLRQAYGNGQERPLPVADARGKPKIKWPWGR